MAKSETFFDAALQTIDRVLQENQELLSALDNAHDLLKDYGAEGEEMDYITMVLLKHDGEQK